MDTNDKTAAEEVVKKPTAREGAELAQQSTSFEKAYAGEISARVKAGLTREQAVEVQRTQVLHDADLEDNKPAKKQAAKK